MDETSPNTVTIQPKSVYGLRTDVVGNIHFTLKQEVIYPVEGVLAFHDYVTNQQRFLRFPEKVTALIITLSPNRRFLGILERTDGETKITYYVAIYDLNTLKKRRSVSIPNARSSEVETIQFTGDSKSIVLLTKPPEETLFLCVYDKPDVVIQGRAANTNLRGTAFCIACNLHEPGIVAVGGDNVFRLLTRSEKGFVIHNIKCYGPYITSLTWIALDILVAGTNRTQLIFVESGEIKAKVHASDVDNIDLSVASGDTDDPEPTELQNVTASDSSLGKDDKVLCLTSFPKGFAYALSSSVHVYQVGETKYKYERKAIISFKEKVYDEVLPIICNIAINQQQDTILVTTQFSQIYSAPLFAPETLNAKSLEFEVLGEPLHTDSIIDMSVCSWKPIIMTASKDQTVRIWNYETGKIELVKKYQVDVTVIRLHPTGLLAAVGFSDQLRLMAIFLDDLEIMKTYNFPHVKNVIFSNLGHLMGVAYDNLVAIISVFNYDILKTLKGHNGFVLAISFSADDKYLYSGGDEGGVYQWDIETGNRVHEVVQKGIEYTALAVSEDPAFIYAITSSGMLREVANSQIVREIKTQSSAPLNSITLSRSNLVMFMANSQGHLYNVQLPFMEAGGGTCVNYRFFTSSINVLKITYDDTLLVTVSSNGTLAIWVLVNNENKIAEIDSELGRCTDVLVRRKILIDKIETINSMKIRMDQQAAEFAYQKEQREKFHQQQVDNMLRTYVSGIEELKKKIGIMENGHVEQLNQLTSRLSQDKDDHSVELAELEARYQGKLNVEYDKLRRSKEEMEEMREEYEIKLRKSAGCLQDTIEALEDDFKTQLKERQELIRQLMQELEEKKSEFAEYCRQVEIENDKNMIANQLEYEKRIKDEQEATVKWRGDAGIYRKRFESSKAEGERLQDQIIKLEGIHNKYQRTLSYYNRDIDDLRREIERRDSSIDEKEKKIHELQNTIQELEKYKHVLNYKITELKSGIKPREDQIIEKRNQIAEMEKELEGLQQHNMSLELQVAELKEKFIGIGGHLNQDKNRARQAEAHMSRICSDIYHITKINDPKKLVDELRKLFHKYSDKKIHQKSTAQDKKVKLEFQRQRDHIEKMAASCYDKLEKCKDAGVVPKLVRENAKLLDELNVLRLQLKESQKKNSCIESKLGIGSKNISGLDAKTKLERACADQEEVERDIKLQMEDLKRQIEYLKSANERLENELMYRPPKNADNTIY